MSNQRGAGRSGGPGGSTRQTRPRRPRRSAIFQAHPGAEYTPSEPSVDDLDNQLALVSISATPLPSEELPIPIRPRRGRQKKNQNKTIGNGEPIEPQSEAPPIPDPTSTHARSYSPSVQPSSTRAATPVDDTTIIRQSIQGFGPISMQPTPVGSEAEDEMEFCTLFPRNGRGQKPSGAWRYFYALGESDTPPPTYSADMIKPLDKKPSVKHVGCCYCNVPNSEGKANPSTWTTYMVNGGTPSNIMRHMRHKHPEILASSASEEAEDGARVFSMRKVLDSLIKWIIVDDQSLCVVESKWFRSLLLALNPDIRDSDIPHRTWVHDETLRLYHEDRVLLKRLLKIAKGRISIAADLWSDQNLRTFMAVTLHWIAETNKGDLELKVALGGFRHIEDSHSGENIARVLYGILEDLDILNKIGGITLDNASNNTTAMDSLANLLKQHGIPFDPEQHRLGYVRFII